MAVSRSIEKKSPGQSPKDFFECKQVGGTKGATKIQPDKSASGPMREKLYGRRGLGKM